MRVKNKPVSKQTSCSEGEARSDLADEQTTSMRSGRVCYLFLAVTCIPRNNHMLFWGQKRYFFRCVLPHREETDSISAFLFSCHIGVCFSFPESSCFDEPRRHPPLERETVRSGGELPARSPAQTGRRHHAVQPAEAVEHHGEAGSADSAGDAESRPLRERRRKKEELEPKISSV